MPRTRRSQARTFGSRKRVASPDEGWFTIRSILDERLVRGRVEYLVDWDDDKTTGEAYSPTWSREVTDEAKEEWNQLKTSRNREKAEQDSQDSQDSQPPRPSNWRQQQKLQTAGPSGAFRRERQGQPERRVRLRSSLTDESERPRKITKVTYSATPSEEPVPSIASLSSTDSAVDDCADLDGLSCPNQRASDAPRSQRLVVQLDKNSQFDPAEYSSQHNTQSSGHSSQSIVELEDQDERLIFASQLGRHTIIPDSQEPSGQTWSVDLQQVEVASSAKNSRETQDNSQFEDYQYPSGLLQAELDSDNLRNLCDQEASGQSPGHLDGPDIPSHQFGEGRSLSVTSQDLCSTIAATKPHSEAQSTGCNNDLAVVPTTSPAPAFLSQPPLPSSFNIPENLSSELQASPARSVVDATPSTQNQNSASLSVVAGDQTEFQDAQVLRITPSVSETEAFTDSHGANKDTSPIIANVSSLPQASDTVSQPSFDLMHDKMENQAAPETSNVASQSSAVDELSQILNLDKVMADGPSFQDHDKPLGGDAGSSEAQLSSLNVPESEAADQRSHTHESVVVEKLSISGTMVRNEMHNPEPPTVSLADISKQNNLHGAALPLIPPLLPQDESHDALPRTGHQSSAVSVSMGQPQPDEASNDGSSDQEPVVLKHIVTLPFQASLRPLYDDTLLEYKKEVTQFGAVFNSEDFIEPEEALVHKIDQVFSRLHNICDYPPDAVGSALEELPSEQLIKYCCDGNSKFNFLHELLQGLTKETRVLIVARSVDILKLLYRLTEALDIECICGDIDKSSKTKSASSVVRATLVLPGTNVDEDDFDVIVGYDHSFGSSEVGKKLEPDIPDARSPVVLMLVTIHSIEHIDLYVPDDLTPLERKNALISGIVRARQLVGDPDRGHPEPHEAASLFLEYLNGLVEGIVWDPVPVPEEILDVYVNSQPRSQMPVTGDPDVENARKRKLDDFDDDDAKRLRMLPFKQSTIQVNDTPIPDDVQGLLSSVKPEESTIKSKGVVSVSVAVLQALAEQVSELRRQVDATDRDAQYKSLISGMEIRIKEYERTSAKMYSSQREALEDRMKFERQTRKAEAALQSATETAQKDAEKAQKKMTDLEATVIRLTADPDGAKETPLAKTQKLLQEAQERTQMLEKRLENAHKDADYARSLYQDATTTNSVLRGENADLKEQVTDLRKKTEDTLGKIHAIQADTTAKQCLRQVRDLRSQLREREIELDCIKDELRQLKSGRRETRQVSVPRSPRTGMMSPRIGRATHGGNGGGGSASRETSPAPTSGVDGVASSLLAGMQYMAQPPGNGRWNHLRD